METKKWYQSKSILIGLGTALVGINVAVTEFVLAKDYSPVGITMLISGILQVYLRTIASLPIE